MPITTKEIAKYSVSLFSDAEPGKMVAAVMLFDAAGKGIAFLRFYPTGVALPANEFRGDLGYVLASYQQDSLASMIDILRNEKPLYFTWYDYLPVRCFGALGTSREPIGEGCES